MARLLVHKQILKNFSGLPVKVQKRVSELVDRFQADPNDPAIGLHPLKESMLDAKVRGASLPGGYRAIIIAPEKGDTYVLVHIDAHDRAYAWAKNKRFEVHGMTGTFQVFDAEEIEVAARELTGNEPERSDYPLGRLDDEELFKAGVPQPLIPSVRGIRSDEELDALSEYLPPDCRDVLYGVAAGLQVDQAIAEMLGATAAEVSAAAPESPGDFSRIEPEASFDLVVVEGEESLHEALERSLEEWRVFLHPYQRRLVDMETKGPMSVTGAAGTGKTVVLMHRAVSLARRLGDTKERILVTTFTTNLSATIKKLIASLDPAVAGRIEITNLHALARAICQRSGWKGRVADEDELEQIWEDVWQDPALGELPLPRDEMRLEYEHVIDPNGIDGEEAYLTTVRSGRPRMGRAQRRAAWPAFRAFQRGLKKRNLMTFEGAVHQARLAVEQGNVPRYAHVLVDEIQDFSLESLKLIRALSPIDEGTRDPLFCVGDGHQRIYRRQVSLGRAGINVRGRRSRRLKINYRTSEQIRRWAQGILKGVEIDDLDGGAATTVGDHSVFKGPEPTVERAKADKAEAAAVVKWITDLAKQGFATHEICVTPYKPAIRTALTDADIPTYELVPKQDDPGSEIPGVRMGTMQRIKGLEFRAVALACADWNDPMNHLEDAELRSRCERYVAATRARERLLIVLSG